MTPTLPQVTHEHHERITREIDRIPAIADGLLATSAAHAAADLDALVSFLEDTLLPHIATAEATLYPELERMFQNRHSMAPMRREHDDVRRQVATLARLTGEAHASGVTLSRVLGLRRVLFGLYATLKIHLAEEEALLHLLDKGVTSDVAEVLAAAMAHTVGEPA